ncbi:hypothetical protein LTR91_013894 [Friedmanniomyces endolithicus]|uniref:Major facilitator superfamily (MFS) profile domain-containing protein n=1 Tax=Friedmanniomyces endolithicus TaxID=329885 RepID=A0AAN6KCR2_9PEZI|nr:hypothetical protein LTR75_002463 [Friedmanniomyces endolithicus]KAK0851290.1 hypothetical protein LTR03_004077 [Friedmanniomyces endolithicus]KAK0868680.1 hypothetical protein LTS02_003521 [Friedmanniomyces endolithicus]KAK0884101.1 hypothetical protein LTR87_002040 [Friedmanniomyces endolithicus]KAK0894917.1 hypothetical protein LTR02_012029 [Friedmanniomyces endolithicus]
MFELVAISSPRHSEDSMDSKAEQRPMIAERGLFSNAEDANDKEHSLTISQAIKLYPKAIAWSVIMSASLIMDGYDLKLVGSLFAQPAFSKAFGHRLPNGTYQVSAAWQTGLNNGSNVGQLFGLLIAGVVAERFGFRKTMMCALVAVPCIIFIQFFSSGLVQLLIGQVLLGVPLGIFQTVSCVYAMEVVPVCLRAYLTSWVNDCWQLGQLLATCILRGTLGMKAPWAYRVPFAVQWFWPIPLLIAVILAPESPWWLVRQDRIEEARLSVVRLTSAEKDHEFDVEKNVALMVLTTEHEREANTGISYFACFKGTDLRRTMIVIGCYCVTVTTGSTVRAYATYFFQQAGLPTTQSFNMSIVLYALGIPAIITAFLLMPYYGRRTIFLWGQAVATLILLAVGALGAAQGSATADSSLAWGIGGLLLFLGFVDNCAVSPIIYALVSELPSSILRSKSVVLARFTYAVVNIIANVLTPYQLNPTAWGWGAKSGFFWGGLSFLGFVFTFLCVPEPKGRTVAELDLLFERRTSARRFASTEVHLQEMRV